MTGPKPVALPLGDTPTLFSSKCVKEAEIIDNQGLFVKEKKAKNDNFFAFSVFLCVAL